MTLLPSYRRIRNLRSYSNIKHKASAENASSQSIDRGQVAVPFALLTEVREFIARPITPSQRIQASQAGHRVAFATAAQWVDRLAAAHYGDRLQDELIRLGRLPLLVIDEVG